MARLPRLHLGCGHYYWPGFINIDADDSGDVQADIRLIEGYEASEIHAIHVIEHLYRYEVLDVLKRWHANLTNGGLLVLECPDLDKVLALANRDDLMRGLFGEYRYESELMTHRWCYSSAELVALCRQAGFVNVRAAAPVFHKQGRDMRVEAHADHQSARPE
jgi:predicted SAM-dependent methyltransferase